MPACPEIKVAGLEHTLGGEVQIRKNPSICQALNHRRFNAATGLAWPPVFLRNPRANPFKSNCLKALEPYRSRLRARDHEISKERCDGMIDLNQVLNQRLSPVRSNVRGDMVIGALVAILLFACASGSGAQQLTATLSGEVTDSTGAVIPNAAVTVTQTTTNAVRTVMSDGSGNYAVTSFRQAPTTSAFPRRVLRHLLPRM